MAIRVKLSESVNNNICKKELRNCPEIEWGLDPHPYPSSPSSSCIPLVMSILESVIWLCYEHVSLDWQCIIITVFTSCNCSLALVPGPGILYGSSLWLVLVLAPMVFLGILQFSSLCKNHQCHSHYCFHCNHHHHHRNSKKNFFDVSCAILHTSRSWVTTNHEVHIHNKLLIPKLQKEVRCTGTEIAIAPQGARTPHWPAKPTTRPKAPHPKPPLWACVSLKPDGLVEGKNKVK